ncbi:spore maturation protein [Bacillota bacterium LX-D]|nr:spore maturation protein [Bacillota bacterium LX-D]
MDFIELISRWAIPLLLLVIPCVGILKGVKVYEAFVAGAEQGFNTAIKIIPFMVGMLVAIGIFRASGAMYYAVQILEPILKIFHFPPEVIPLAVMRPLSGGGSLALAAELIRTHGPDSFLGRLASTMQGSTDTTFYVLTVYFGSVGIRKYRYAVTLGIIADLTTLIAALFITNLVFSG